MSNKDNEELKRPNAKGFSDYRKVLDALPTYVFVKDLNGVYLACNKACEKFFGEPEREIIGKTDFDFVDTVQAQSFKTRDLIAIHSATPQVNEEWVTLAENGAKRLFETTKTPLYNNDNEVIGLIGVAYDITDKRRLEERLLAANKHLTEQACTDSLTGIGNRRSYNTNLEQEWLRGVRDDQYIGMIIIDVDFFKEFNDTYGHESGDNCLIALAHFLNSKRFIRRPTDYIARYGGEEFAIVLGNTTREYVKELANRIVESVCEDLAIPHSSTKVPNLLTPNLTVSVGASCAKPQYGVPACQLFNIADQALYDAKNKGRNQYVFREFDATLPARP